MGIFLKKQIYEFTFLQESLESNEEFVSKK